MTHQKRKFDIAQPVALVFNSLQRPNPFHAVPHHYHSLKNTTGTVQTQAGGQENGIFAHLSIPENDVH